MLLDLSSIKEGIANIKQTLAGLGSEGFYTIPSNNLLYNVPTFSASGQTINADQYSNRFAVIAGRDYWFIPKKDGLVRAEFSFNKEPYKYGLISYYHYGMLSNAPYVSSTTALIKIAQAIRKAFNNPQNNMPYIDISQLYATSQQYTNWDSIFNHTLQSLIPVKKGFPVMPILCAYTSTSETTASVSFSSIKFYGTITKD